MDWLAVVHLSTYRARFALLLRLALDFTGRVSSDASLASDSPSMVRFDSTRGYWSALYAIQISGMSADGISHLAAGSLYDCGIGASVAARRADARLVACDDSRRPGSVCPSLLPVYQAGPSPGPFVLTS
jgi:hypothetical protein